MADGLSAKLVPVLPSFTSVYVAAPDGVIVVVLPEQMVGLLTEAIEIVGVAFTTISVVAEFADGQV